MADDQPETTQRHQEITSEIVDVPQTYDGEHHERLVKLGASAVPAIGQALLNEPGFPLVFVKALESIGDERGVEPLLAFIGRRRPYADHDRSFITSRAIQALGILNDETLVDPMRSILQDESAHMRVRLAAATAVATVGSGDAKRDAVDYMISLRNSRSDLLSLYTPNCGYGSK